MMRVRPFIAGLLAAVVTGMAAAAAANAQDAQSFWCDERQLGTHFYCEPPEPIEDEEASASQAAQPNMSAAQQLEAIREELEETRARAVLAPTRENITSYIQMQRQQLDRASTFADSWSRAIWQNPSLDYTLERPVTTLGKQTWADERQLQQASMMADLTSRYGVFYFYSSACAACRTFNPILRALSDQYGLEVMAVSMDGGPNPVFPNAAVDQGHYARMGLQGGKVPALVLFDTVTRQPVPIGYGVMSQDQIISRIHALTTTRPGEDY